MKFIAFYAADSNLLHNLRYIINQYICFLGIQSMVLPLLVHNERKYDYFYLCEFIYCVMKQNDLNF